MKQTNVYFTSKLVGEQGVFFIQSMIMHHFLKHVMYDLIRSGLKRAKNKQKEALSP